LRGVRGGFDAAAQIGELSGSSLFARRLAPMHNVIVVRRFTSLVGECRKPTGALGV